MSIKISPAILEASYELLRMTEPFNRWKLPSAERVSFCVNSSKTNAGEFFVDPTGIPWVAVSQRFHHTLPELFKTVAHEMCHLRQQVRGEDYTTHGATFIALAKRVCKAHQFDLGAF